MDEEGTTTNYGKTVDVTICNVVFLTVPVDVLSCFLKQICHAIQRFKVVLCFGGC